MLLSHHEGGRTVEDAQALFEDVESKRSHDSPLPVFVSDNWDPFEIALLLTYGTLEEMPYSGVGRPPNPVLMPHPDLKYAQVCKKRKNSQIVKVIQRVVFGNEEEVRRLLGVDEEGCINTAYVERINLTTRNCLARFIRMGMNFSKDPEIHSLVLDFYQAWYNIVKPHKSLRIPCSNGIQRWKKRSPMMAEGRTDHIWTVKELLSFRVPVHS